MSIDFEKVSDIGERLGAAAEAELEGANPVEVAIALNTVLATVIATMPREDGDLMEHLVRTELADNVDGARSKMK